VRVRAKSLTFVPISRGSFLSNKRTCLEYGKDKAQWRAPLLPMVIGRLAEFITQFLILWLNHSHERQLYSIKLMQEASRLYAKAVSERGRQKATQPQVSPGVTQFRGHLSSKSGLGQMYAYPRKCSGFVCGPYLLIHDSPNLECSFLAGWVRAICSAVFWNSKAMNYPPTRALRWIVLLSRTTGGCTPGRRWWVCPRNYVSYWSFIIYFQLPVFHRPYNLLRLYPTFRYPVANTFPWTHRHLSSIDSALGRGSSPTVALHALRWVACRRHYFGG
jgi:hypothetical protein